MSEPVLLQEKQPQRFEGRNIRTPKRSGATNDIYLVQFEITREAWEALESVPKTALLEGILWFHYGDTKKAAKNDTEPEIQIAEPDKKVKKERPGTDENGRYWQRMERPGNYYAIPGVAEALNCQPVQSEVNKAIRKAFDVDTRRQVSPSDLEAWAASHGLENLINVSRTAQAQASRNAEAGA